MPEASSVHGDVGDADRCCSRPAPARNPAPPNSLKAGRARSRRRSTDDRPRRPRGRLRRSRPGTGTSPGSPKSGEELIAHAPQTGRATIDGDIGGAVTVVVGGDRNVARDTILDGEQVPGVPEARRGPITRQCPLSRRRCNRPGTGTSPGSPNCTANWLRTYHIPVDGRSPRCRQRRRRCSRLKPEGHPVRRTGCRTDFGRATCLSRIGTPRGRSGRWRRSLPAP